MKKVRKIDAQFIDNDKNAALCVCATDCKVQSLNFNNQKNTVQYGN